MSYTICFCWEIFFECEANIVIRILTWRYICYIIISVVHHITKGVLTIELSRRQQEIINIINAKMPITGEEIAGVLGVTRSALRTDLQVLSKLGYLDAKPKVGYITKTKKSNTEDFSKKLVSDVMSVAAIINEKESLHSTIVKIFLEDVGSIFIIGEKGLSGVVSRKDLVKAMMGGLDLNTVPVSMIMTRMPNIVTLSEHDTVEKAVKKLIVHEIDSLPVISERDGVSYIVGRFTKTNATKLFAEAMNPREGNTK